MADKTYLVKKSALTEDLSSLGVVTDLSLVTVPSAKATEADAEVANYEADDFGSCVSTAVTEISGPSPGGLFIPTNATS